MESKFFTVKEVVLNNNCPECYSTEGLQLTFKQKFVENTFYRAISNDIKHSMICHTCHTEIFPERWTEGLERVYEYQAKALTPKKAAFKLKKLSWILIVVLIVLVILLIVFLYNA